MAKLSRRAISSSNLMSPYSSILSSTMAVTTPAVHESDAGHDSGSPFTSTVAVSAELEGRPSVSTTIELVPCPLAMAPAETVQLKAWVAEGSAPETVAAKVACSPPRIVSAHETVTTGQSGAGRAPESSAWKAASEASVNASARRFIFVGRAGGTSPRPRALDSSRLKNSGGRAAVAAELRAGRERVVAVLAGLRLH